MKRLLIVYYSRTGAARQMAQAAEAGAACEPQCAVSLITAPDATERDVREADGYIFAAPENLASLAGPMKDFFDRTYYPVLDHVAGRPYAALIAAGSDGQGAARQIGRIVTGWRLKAVGEPLIICTHAQTMQAILAQKSLGDDDLARCTELGAMMAAGLAMGIF